MKPQQEISDELIEEAIQWSVAVRSGTAGPELIQACEAWRAKAIEHERAWQCIQQLEAPFVCVTAVGAATPAVADAGRRVLERATLHHPELPRRRMIRALCLATATGALGYTGYTRLSTSSDYTSSTGQRKTVVLADNTRIELDAASAIDVHYTAQSRSVFLRKGQILVQTGHRSLDGMPPPPFWVATRQGRMQALGTRFLVRLESSSTIVQVEEGEVGVYVFGTNTPGLLGAGQARRLTNDGRIGTFVPQPDATAWTNGVVVAQSMRLGELIDRLSPYRRGWLVCAQSVADLRVSGVFSLDNTEVALSAIARSVPVRIERLTDYWIRVTPA